ncbi:MAG: hypothetical protein IKA02_00515, partial [Clostridia bacterium]|nr:hypothetical protein [Clostridia bacterium]
WSHFRKVRCHTICNICAFCLALCHSEDIGGCANPNCDNYVPPQLSLAELSQSDEDVIDENCEVYYNNPEDYPLYKEEEKWEFDEDYHNDYTVSNKENEDDYEISEEDDESNGFTDTLPQKNTFKSIIEWLILIGLCAFTVLFMLEILK